MSALLDQLMQSARVWQASRQVSVSAPTEPTGYSALDQVLTGNGWPRGALTELLLPQAGSGELALLLPLMQQLSRRDRTILLIDPPHMPYLPALQRDGVTTRQIMIARTGSMADFLWTYEQALRSGACDLVTGWPGRLRPANIRRLQLAAESSASIAILLRDASLRDASSPAALRLLLAPAPRKLYVEVIKRRGGWVPGAAIPLTPPHLSRWLPAATPSSGAKKQVDTVINGPWSLPTS